MGLREALLQVPLVLKNGNFQGRVSVYGKAENLNALDGENETDF